MKTSHNKYTHQRGASGQAVTANNKPHPHMLPSVTLLLPAAIVAASVVMKLPLAGTVATLLAYFGLLFISARMLNKGSMIPNRIN